jgi:hypothetical protein
MPPGRALMPGLVNGTTTRRRAWPKGTFDRYNLETYLNAQPARPAGARWRTSTCRR